MTRKLLPFEHELIDILDISKDEYLEFVALQAKYSDIKLGTNLDVRNEVGVVALVLTIVGMIAQVVSALLTPQPQVPELPGIQKQEGGGQQQTRDERFSPRFGFNSVQELATYGEPVNLVYANRGTGTGANPNGGVRITSALLWSAVRSYGSSQFIQMLLLLAGGAITAIDPEKSAFGQTPIRDLITNNLWMYFNPGATGFLAQSNELNNQSTSDPTSYGQLTDNPYRIQTTAANVRVDGFSQAYSPTTSNTCGIYGVVPLNVLLYLRNSTGDKQSVNLGVYAQMTPWVTGSGVSIPLNTELTVRITKTSGASDAPGQEAEDARRSIVSTFDVASIFKLGTALFKVTQLINPDIENVDASVTLKCITAGRAPSAAYTSLDPTSTTPAVSEEDRAEYDRLRPGALALLNEDQRPDITNAAQLADSGEIRVASYSSYQATRRERSTPTRNGWGRGSWLSCAPGWRLQDFGYPNQYCERDVNYTAQSFNGYVRSRTLTTEEISLLRRYEYLDSIVVNLSGAVDDVFYTKALVRISQASYETVSQCHIVDLALKAVVYKRISGRQMEYGSGRRGGYPASDNGIKPRVSLFKLRYKEVGQTQYSTIPGIFAISRAADNENYVYIKFNSGLTDPTTATQWAFELEPISDPLAERQVSANYFYLENTGNAVTYTLETYRLNSGSTTVPSIQFTGLSLTGTTRNFPPQNNNPADLNEWDLFNYDSDTQLQFSFDAGPEITLTAATEQVIQPFSDYTTVNGAVTRQLYNNLALYGFNAYSGKTIQDLRSFSVFATQGRRVRRIRTSGTDEFGTAWGDDGYVYYPSTPDGASSLAPDIFLDTVIDSDDGIGNYAEVNAIDLRQLALTKRFCQANNLFMDCMIASPRSWREFWVEVAPFNLLEFARIGGRETLVPAVPFDPNTGQITRTINVSAIFNQGNIIEDSYKEEYMDFGSNVQDIIASVIYTDIPEDAVFSKKKSLEVQLADTLEVDAIRQTFDLSLYVTNPEQAILFGKLICNLRRYVRQAIEFKTYPTLDPISPGAFVYVDIGQNSWDAIRTGMIGVGGALNMPLDNNLLSGTYNFRLYRSDRGLLDVNTVTVTNGVAPQLADYENFLFVLGVETTTRRIFRVSEVQMDEEGEITVRATIYPCTTDGQSLIADFSDNLFTIRR
jgi:hypothetical protein